MHFLITHLDELAEKLLQHIYLTLIAIIVAILIGVPLGIIIIRNEKLRSWVLGITSTLQTIPSLALLAFLIPFLGIGVKPTIVVLAIYALLPIVRNTYTGLSGIEEEVLEAADGLGFTASQRLFKIELPLALPVIIAGVRTSTAMTVGITTIAAFIGAGGLGDFITQGLALNDSRLILLGAIPAALLALVLDYIIAQLEQALSSRQRKTIRLKRTKLAVVSILLITFVTWSVQQWIAPFFQSQNNRVIIGSKNFTESFILADMMAELLKAKTNLNIVKKLNIGATDILQQAILNKAIDIYPEYTGTAYLTILKQRKILSAAKTFQIVKQSYQDHFDLTWLKPFGFDNSQTLMVRAIFAKQHHLNTISDIVPIAAQLIFAAAPECVKRPDCLVGMKKVYGLQFKQVKQMQPDLLYEAIDKGAVDVIEGYTTDGRILLYHLKPLIDNKHLVPPYDAAPIIRTAILTAHPEIKTVLQLLAGKINNQRMQQMNYQVNVKGLTPAMVAHQFLLEQQLISK